MSEPTWMDRVVEGAPSVGLFSAFVMGGAAVLADLQSHESAGVLSRLMVAAVLTYLALSAIAETPHAHEESRGRDRALVALSRVNLPVCAAAWVFAAHDHPSSRLVALVGFLLFIAHVVGRYLRAQEPG